MRWVAIFEDTEKMQLVRNTYERAHLEYLFANDSEIVLAGGLRDAPDGSFVGGLWVLEVSSRERAMIWSNAILTLSTACEPIGFIFGAKRFPSDGWHYECWRRPKIFQPGKLSLATTSRGHH